MNIDKQQLSRLLFESREIIDMYSDVIEARMGERDAWLDRVRDEIDELRRTQGWSPHGFGDER